MRRFGPVSRLRDGRGPLSASHDSLPAAVTAWQQLGSIGVALAMSILLVQLAAPAMAQPVKQNDAAPVREAGKPIRFLISGHSLTDNPLPEYITAIAASQGFPTTWNQQNIVGSRIECRTAGCGPSSGPWSGYRRGKNNNNRRDMDIPAELRKRRDSGGYDTLIITESQNSVAAIRNHDTVRLLRQFHELLIEGNPEGTTYFYEPWQSLKDLSDPTPWIALEREATQAWGCVATRINQSLAHESRNDRIQSLPIAAGLAELIERTTTQQIAGLSASTTEATMKRFFSDDVHLTTTGIYYVALLNYVGITGRRPHGAWHPNSLSREQATALQDIALSFFEKRNRNYRPLLLPECIEHMVSTFCEMWNSYVPGKWAPYIHDCKAYFGRRTAVAGEQPREQNPFVFDPVTEATYWHPPP